MANSLKWVAFPGTSASLKLLSLPPASQVGESKSKPRFGLFLDLGEDASSEMREKALKFGFSRVKNTRAMRMFLKPGDAPKITEIATALGGKTINVSRENLLSSLYHIDMRKMKPKEPVSGTEDKPQAPSVPDPDTLREIGLNRRGETVVRDDAGRFYIKSASGSEPSYIAENERDPGDLFLRIRSPGDIPGIAAGLLNMAKVSVLRPGEFKFIVEAAIEEGPFGPPGKDGFTLDAKTASDRLLSEIQRQIILKARSGSPDVFRLCEHIQPAMDSRTAEGPADLSGVGLHAFIASVLSNRDDIHFEGPSDESPLKRLERPSSGPHSSQVIDFSSEQGDLSSRAANIISRRKPDGVSVFLVRGGPGSLPVESLRDTLSLSHGLEMVATLAPNLTKGSSDGFDVTSVIVGEARPTPLDSVPDAALRNNEASSMSDLLGLTREVIRSRRKIREFIDGNGPDLDDDREESSLYTPYISMSRSGAPFAMAPKTLMGAIGHAQKRVIDSFKDMGGVDHAVAGLGGVTISDLSEKLTPEQIDAVAMQRVAMERSRGFLLSDATGVGKGRALQYMAMAHVRSGGRVICLTESPQINIPDVFRDACAVGRPENFAPIVLTAGGAFDVEAGKDEDGSVIIETMERMPHGMRKDMFSSYQWPEGVNYIATTYSTFKLGDRNDDGGLVQMDWIRSAISQCEEADIPVMIIADECHNALNPTSRTGEAVRAMINESSFHVLASATPLRDNRGLDLYKGLLPEFMSPHEKEAIFEAVKSGGESAQESFMTSLIEDGVALRREHDLSQLEFLTVIPEDEDIVNAENTVFQVGRVVENMLASSRAVGELTASRENEDRARLIRAGLDVEDATRMAAMNIQYSSSLGSPIGQLNAAVIAAVKVDMVVKEAIRHLGEGKKPLIPFSSTNEAVLKDVLQDAGLSSSDDTSVLPPLDFRDVVHRLHERVYRYRRDGEVRDARDEDPQIAHQYEITRDIINQIPDNLPVTPIDAIREGIEAAGYSFGEVSGRNLCYRGGRIQKRGKIDKKVIIDGFNNGHTDVLAYNDAGATGGSFHAGVNFKDRKRRVFIEFEGSKDIVKFVQSLGRGNRYGQESTPLMVSINSGLSPEIRLTQQRNRKLRLLGASVDANRSHPFLSRDVPDMLNRVGDFAAYRFLSAEPDLALRLGFDDIAEQNLDDSDTGGLYDPILFNVSNRAYARMMILRPEEARRAMARLESEFEALIEELDSRNANPLTVKTVPGVFEPRAATPFMGHDREEGDYSGSAFTDTVTLETGIMHLTSDPITVNDLMDRIERSLIETGRDGLQVHADYVRENMPVILRSYLLEGVDMAEALRDPASAGHKFHERFKDLEHLSWMLENIKPGVEMSFPSLDIDDYRETVIITGVKRPSSESNFLYGSSYNIRYVAPGDDSERKVNLQRLLRLNKDSIFFRPGLEDGITESVRSRFEAAGVQRRQTPVQLLTGNIIQAISISKRNGLGSVVVVKDAEDHIRRGIYTPKHKVNLEHLPSPIQSNDIAKIAIFKNVTRETGLRWTISEGPDHKYSQILVSVGSKSIEVSVKPPSKTSHSWWDARPGLHDALYGKPLPKARDIPTRRGGYKRSETETIIPIKRSSAGRIDAILTSLAGSDLWVTSSGRDAMNEASNDFRLMGAADFDAHSYADIVLPEDEPEVETDPADMCIEGENPDVEGGARDLDHPDQEIDQAPDRVGDIGAEGRSDMVTEATNEDPERDVDEDRPRVDNGLISLGDDFEDIF